MAESKHERLYRYDLGRPRIVAARKAVIAAGLKEQDAGDAVTIARRNASDPACWDAVLVCWRCEESMPADGQPDEGLWLQRFWRDHWRCGHPCHWDPEDGL